MTPLLLAAVLAISDRGVLVAHDGSIEMFDRTATNRIWSGEGLPTPSRIVTSNQQAVIIDPLASQIRMIDLASGRGTTLRTGETPIDGMFLNGRIYLLERDARALERIGADGARASIALAADPAFLRQAGGRIYAYSRTAGVIQEITTSPFEIRRTVGVAPFASDLELDAKNAYLIFPRGGKIRIVELATMKNSGSFDVGAVPVDAAFASSGTALTARTLAVADPSAKRVWMVQGAESFCASLRARISAGADRARSVRRPRIAVSDRRRPRHHPRVALVRLRFEQRHSLSIYEVPQLVVAKKRCSGRVCGWRHRGVCLG